MSVNELCQELTLHAEKLKAARVSSDWQSLAQLERQLVGLLRKLPSAPSHTPVNERANLSQSLSTVRDELTAARQQALEWQNDVRPMLDAFGQKANTA